MAKLNRIQRYLNIFIIFKQNNITIMRKQIQVNKRPKTNWLKKNIKDLYQF